MSDQGRDNSPSLSPTADNDAAAPAQPSLRDIAESAYDDVVDAAEADDGSEGGQDRRGRDSLGRFVAADRDKPGEQSTDPAPREIPGTTQPKTPEPAPAGSSTQVPEHWSAELKSAFTKWAPDVQGEFLQRHREMEADYTRKSQASAGAVQFANALEPVFTDPDISRAMQAAGFNAIQAIHDWGGMFKRAMSPEIRDRVALLVDMTERMGLDPARLFATGNRQEPELSPEDMNDPAIRYFADKLGRTTNDLQSVQQRLDGMLRQEAENRQQETVKGFLWQINSFGDEKDQQGHPLHPHFDNPAVMQTLHEMFAANPQRDLKEAYDAAVWANAETRKSMLEAERQQLFGQESAQRARAAMRGNTRGITSPVAKPNAAGNGKAGLRGVLENSADEIGF